MARKLKTQTKLLRSEMLSTAVCLRRVSHVSLLRSLRTILDSIIYEHSVPTGLIVLGCTVVVAACIIAAPQTAHATAKTDLLDPQNSAADYSKFKHNNPNHTRLPCALCHRRETNAPRPTMPGSNGHLPCAGCHAQQFANSTGPICTICHADGQSSKLKPFPRLSSFNMKFDHARHVKMRDASCASCHRPSRAGVAISIPAGVNAHTTCFGCHSPGAKSGDRDISSCGVCHEPGRHVRTRETAAAFRVGFSHAEHDQSEGLTCNECHRVRVGVPRRVQVSAPQALNHHASSGAFSCMSCHNGKRAFGGDDFSVCTRCHTRTTWHF